MLGFDRVTFDAEVMAGRACIRDTRVPVSILVNLLAHDLDFSELVAALEEREEEIPHIQNLVTLRE